MLRETNDFDLVVTVLNYLVAQPSVLGTTPVNSRDYDGRSLVPSKPCTIETKFGYHIAAKNIGKCT